MGWLELCAVQWGEVHSPTSGEEWPQNDQYRQDTVWKAAFQKRMLEFSVLSRSMNLQYVLVVKKKLMVFGHDLRSVLPAGRGKWSFPYDQDWWTTPEVLFAMYINSWRESSKKRQAGSFQWCPVTGPEAIPKAGEPILLEQQVWTTGPPEVSSNFSHSMTVWLVLSCIPFWYCALALALLLL